MKPFPAPDSQEALERYLKARTRQLVETHWPLDLRSHLRHNQTEGEASLWSMLRNRQLCDLKFRRQHSIGPYFADFYCPEASLVVELDGPTHAERAAYDNARDRYMQEHGLEILRIPAVEFYSSPEQVLERIAHTALPRIQQNAKKKERGRQ